MSQFTSLLVLIPQPVSDIVNLDMSSKDVMNIKESPASAPYFMEENFFLHANIKYDELNGMISTPKKQKLKSSGISLCAWFIPKTLLDKRDESRELFQALSVPEINENHVKRLLESQSKQNNGNQESVAIDALKEKGEPYLASILDLDKNHISLLESLKKKTLDHLEKRYGINEDDDVSLAFHFPYCERHASLHLQVRVNQGIHPCERSRSYMLDDVILGLKSGKNISKIILDRQEKNKQGHYWRSESLEFLKENGVIVKNTANRNALRIAQSEAVYVPSHDDTYAHDAREKSFIAPLKRSLSLERFPGSRG